jgi:signal transduction histidine kinase
MVLAAALAGGGTGARAESADELGFAERAARFLSPEMRRIDARLKKLAEELEILPELLPGPIASRYGFRSETMFDPDVPQWLQIDLGRRQVIDRIVAVPAHIPELGKQGEGYGFPRRFRIEVADDPEMKTAKTVIDRTTADVPNPGRYPLDLRIEPAAGRFVRFTSTRHCGSDAGFFWALEELMVLVGNRMAGVGNPMTASNSINLFPNWSLRRADDGLSALGTPVGREPSPTRGYLSATTADRLATKWLTVDLREIHRIDEVRLVPVAAEDFEVQGPRGFPREVIVELALDPAFERIVATGSMRSSHPAVPGSCAIVIPCGGTPARYLRARTHELWDNGGGCGYALAEIQAYAGDRNVALGKTVTASDVAGAGGAWSPAFLTDGFGSRFRLAEWPDYLDRIQRRARVERERDELRSRRAEKVRATGLALGYGGGGLGGLAILGSGWLLVRQRGIRRRAVIRMREQIARDLHDDIGTNLGGIVLVSEIGGRHSDDPQAREDFQTIREAAEQTSQSMQDIVWLIERGNAGLRELISRMRETTELILGDKRIALEIDPSDFRDRRLSLSYRRHLFFAYKEALHNIRRHADATAVEVRISIDGRTLRFEVRDNGVGFDAESPSSSGHGLSNLRQRAERLHGVCRVESRPGAGTRVVFETPMHSRK